MKRNEAKRNLLRLFVLSCVFLIHIGVVQSVAEDAFVVEEEAVIGGENARQEPPPVAAPQINAAEPADATEKETKTAKKEKYVQKGEDGQETEKEEQVLSVSENVISQNSANPLFWTPARKKGNKHLTFKRRGGDKERKGEGAGQFRSAHKGRGDCKRERAGTSESSMVVAWGRKCLFSWRMRTMGFEKKKEMNMICNAPY